MKLDLLKFLNSNLSQWELLDPSIKPTPAKSNPWALWMAWMIDWLFCIFITKICVMSWIGFMNTLGLQALPSQIQDLIATRAKGLEIILYPLIFVCIHYTSMFFHSKTLGMKLFKHQIIFQNDKSVWAYTLALLVSPVLLGLPILVGWIDDFAQTHSLSEEYFYYDFTFVNEESFAFNLHEQLAEESPLEQDWQKAA
jgi:hypothetical protein